MEFEQRLQKAIERGQRLGSAKAREAAARAMSEEELRNLHAQYRRQLCERIESSLRRLPDHFPGFQLESFVDERGWGASVVRDDLELKDGQRRTFYSRLDVGVRPFGAHHVLDLAAKGTIRNKEAFNRSQYQKLGEVDLESLLNLADLWILEYAERYASAV